ncbi:hypothetical protein [Kitasatospora sp. NPDC059571]|uniref:hypothetical protein n=1 Tax=Kitasatospora sp. NPDC059571 TaxID=3346871 RepID=UPI0036A4A24A
MACSARRSEFFSIASSSRVTAPMESPINTCHWAASPATCTATNPATSHRHSTANSGELVKFDASSANASNRPRLPSSRLRAGC